MSFYSKLECSKSEGDRHYTVKTTTGDLYEFRMSSADFKFDKEDYLIIFTTILNYRISLNCTQIESIKWDII